MRVSVNKRMSYEEFVEMFKEPTGMDEKSKFMKSEYKRNMDKIKKEEEAEQPEQTVPVEQTGQTVQQ